MHLDLQRVPCRNYSLRKKVNIDIGPNVNNDHAPFLIQ